jgi:diacylglycerol kinase family enzyme
MEIRIDGDLWYKGPVFLAAVSNGRYFGGSMMIAPRAAMDDGLFDIVLIKALSRREVTQHIGKIYRGEHMKLTQVDMARGRHVRIRTPDQASLEMDGEQPGALDATFSIVDERIPFLVP